MILDPEAAQQRMQQQLEQQLRSQHCDATSESYLGFREGEEGAGQDRASGLASPGLRPVLQLNVRDLSADR